MFRAGIMSSGSSVPTGDITELQGTYDFVVDQVGCSGSNDTLACLRTVSTDSLLAAANNTPSFIGFSVRAHLLFIRYAGLTVRVQGLATPYFPRADGAFVTLPPGELSLEAEAADVPFIIGTSIPASSVLGFNRVHGSSGDVKDEGTLFSLGSLNITYAFPSHGYPGTNVRMLTHTHRTDDEVASYISETWFPGSSLADLNKTLELYPSDPAAGSPFDTGDTNAFTPEYKRIAAIQGDWFFNGPRRQFLDAFSANRTAYNFCASSLSPDNIQNPS